MNVQQVELLLSMLLIREKTITWKNFRRVERDIAIASEGLLCGWAHPDWPHPPFMSLPVEERRRLVKLI